MNLSAVFINRPIGYDPSDGRTSRRLGLLPFSNFLSPHCLRSTFRPSRFKRHCQGGVQRMSPSLSPVLLSDILGKSPTSPR